MAEASAKTSNPVELEIRFLFLESTEEVLEASAGLESLAEHTRMVATVEADNPIRGATRFAVGARFATGAPAIELWSELEQELTGRTRATRSYRGSLPIGVSTVFRLQAEEVIEDPDNFLGEWPHRGPVEKRLAIGAQLDAAMDLGIGLGFSDLAEGERAIESGVPPEGGSPHGAYLQHEWLVPNFRPELDGGPLVFLVPSPFATGEGRACAIRIEARTQPIGQTNAAEASGDVARSELHASREDVIAAALEAADRVTLAQTPVSPENLKLRNLMRAYAALHETTDASRWRGLLFTLSTGTQARLAEDLAMIADESSLCAFVDSLPALSPDLELTPPQLGWQLEHGAWRFLSKLAMNEGLPLWLDALCVRHAGEVGRYPSSIEQLCLQSANSESFHTLLVRENLLFLEDSNVSARVRAFDWLRRLSLAPADFDPLGNNQDRRTALAQFNDAQNATENN